MKLEQAKALFFAQYLGLKLCVVTKPDNLEYSQTPFDENEGGLFLTGILNSQVIVRRIAEDVKDRFEQTALLLRSVHQLTDEETLHIATIILGEDILKTQIAIKMHRTQINKYLRENSMANDYAKAAGVIRLFTYIDENGKPITLQPEEIIALNWAKTN